MTNYSPRAGFSGSVGRSWVDGGFQINHCHAELEFNLILAGRGRYVLDEGEYDLRPGTLVWLMPGQMHRLDRSPDLDMWVVLTQARLWDATLIGDVATYPLRKLPNDDVATLDRLFAQIAQDADEPDLYNAGLTYALHSARRASRTSARARPEPFHPTVTRALALMRGASPPDSLEALALACASTGNHIGRLLLQHTGVGYVEWRNRVRLERFQTVYTESGGLLEAALEAGFGSYVQFHRVFVAQIGCTPGDWVKAGADVDRVAFASAGALIARLDSGARMDWNALAALVLPVTRAWIDDGFRAVLTSKFPARTGAGLAASYQPTDADVALVHAELVDSLQGTDPDGALLLGHALASYDMRAEFSKAGTGRGFDQTDVADMVAAYLTIAWIAANNANGPNLDQTNALRRRSGAALAASAGFADAGNHLRHTVGEAYLAQALFLFNAWLGARNGGDAAALESVSVTARSGALRILGIDLREHRLDF